MPSFRVTQLAARRAKPVKHRPAAIDRKAVHGKQMLCKAVGIAALEVTDRTAPRALFVKMRVAVTRSANVLINASPPVVALKFSNRLVAAKIAKMTVDTAPALLGIPVDGKANAALLRFLAGKLKLPKNSIELCSGASSRDKRVFAAGITIDQIEERLK